MNADHEPLIHAVDEIPVLPSVLARVMSLDPTADNYFDEMIAIAETDPGFAVKLLHLANSALVRRAREVSNVREAVTRLGTRLTGELLTALSVIRVFVPKTAAEQALWTHSIGVGNAARRMAVARKDKDAPPDEAYLAGLVHDIGRFVMFQGCPDKLGEVDESDWQDTNELIQIERATMGIDHGALGGMAARKWALPDRVCRVIDQHHERNFSALDRDVTGLIALVRQADAAMVRVLKAAPDDLLDACEASVAPGWPCMRPEVMAPLLERVVADTNATAQALGLTKV